MTNFSLEDIVKGFENKNTEIIQWAYDTHIEPITRMVVANNGTPEDAEDLLQNAIIALYNKAQARNLFIYTAFATFLQSICYKLWLKHLRNQKKEKEKLTDIALETEAQTYIGIEEEFEEVSYYGLYQKHYQKLPERCRKILDLSMEKTSQKEIAKILGIKSEGYLKKLKHQCKEQLVKNIKNDPQYKKFL